MTKIEVSLTGKPPASPKLQSETPGVASRAEMTKRHEWSENGRKAENERSHDLELEEVYNKS